MKQNSKLKFQHKCYKYVASPLGEDLLWHRTTLRAEDETPRSTSHFDNFLCRNERLYCKFIANFDKRFETFDFFFIFSFLAQILQLVIRNFNPRIIYRSWMLIAHSKTLNEAFLEMK